ncbi:MAG: ECF transporter S component [Oscillospiraceae bacterium]|nr:ECF transporter S component [Oscillospiraceae bacterium]
MRSTKTKTIVILGMLTALLLIFSLTPIGTIPVGPLSITLNTIPVAIGAIALGPVGGLAMGTIFGLLSFGQAIGIGVASAMGAALYDISPFFCLVQRLVPRMLDGLLIGLLHSVLQNKIGGNTSSFVTGFFAAFLNTVFFMSALVLLFSNTEYMGKLMAGKTALAYIVSSIGLNAIVEMIVTTIVAGAAGTALYQSRILPLKKQSQTSQQTSAPAAAKG